VIAYARSMHVAELFGIVMKENAPMLSMCEELGFKRKSVADEPSLYEVTLQL